MNNFGAISSEHVSEFANKIMGSHNRLSHYRKSPCFFLLALINASISYVSHVVLLLPILPLATTDTEKTIL